MTEVDTSSGDVADEPAVKRSASIVRAHTWQRMSADEAIFFTLGHDVEICFTARSPFPVEATITDDGDGDEVTESFKLNNLIEEIVRIRIPPIAATALAFNIIAKQASGDVFEKSKLEAQFQRIISMIPDPKEITGDE